jgi:hypothetical protein
MDLVGAKHPFWTVAWRRYATVGSAGAWSVFEWVMGDPFWGVLFTGMTALAAWELIIKYKPPVDEGKPDAKP